MREFAFNSYCTEYSYQVNDALLVPLRSYACFRSAFEHLDDSVKSKVTAKYKIILHRGLNWCKRNGASNACLLGRKNLKQHLDQIKDIIPFTYKIRCIEEDNDPRFILDVEINEGTIIQHKYILSWIRYAYEYPYNVALLEAQKLRFEKGFRFEAGYNLFNLVAQCFGLLTGGHSIASGYGILFMKKSSLAEKLSSVHITRLNNIFDKSGNVPRLSLERTSKIKKRLNCSDIEFWTDNSLFQEERLPIYKQLLKELKTR